MATVVNGKHSNNNTISNGTFKDSMIESKKCKLSTDVNGNETLSAVSNGHNNTKIQNGHNSVTYEPIKKCGPVDLKKVLTERHSHVR